MKQCSFRKDNSSSASQEISPILFYRYFATVLQGFANCPKFEREHFSPGPPNSFLLYTLLARSEVCEKTASFVTSVLPFVWSSPWTKSAPFCKDFHEICIWIFLGNLHRKFEFHYNLTRITGTLLEDVFAFITFSFLLRIRNISDKICEGQSKHAISVQWIFSEERAVREITRKTVVQPDRPQTTI
jgi:hypothetical protein